MPEIYIKIGVIVEDENGNILLIKERVERDKPLAWNMIKGSYELSDGNLIECAKRECLEEAGIEVQILGIHNMMFFRKQDKLKIQYNFVAKPMSKDVSLPNSRGVMIEGENIQAVEWIEPEKITQMKPTEFVADYTLGILQSWINTKKIYPLDILVDIKV